MYPYRLSNIIDDNGTIGIPVVHGRERLVSFLTRRVPNLELYSCVLVEGNGLGQEGSANGGLPVIIELILVAALAIIHPKGHPVGFHLTLTKRKTSDDCRRC